MLINQELIRDLSQVNMQQDRDQLLSLTQRWSEKLLAQALAGLFVTGCFSLSEIIDLLNYLPSRNRMLVYSDLPVNLQALILVQLKERSGPSRIQQKIKPISLTNPT